MEVPLSRLRTGERAAIKSFRGGLGIQRRMSSLGIITGKRVKIVSAHPLMGPIVVRIDNMKIAIGRGMANKVIVEK